MKAPAKSKTLWVAVVTGVLAAVNYATGTIENSETLSIVLLVQAVLAVVLRWLTKEPLGKEGGRPRLTITERWERRPSRGLGD